MIGCTLSHFRVEELIGEGGMGVVYRATDLRLGRTVALKVLPPRLVGDPERRARFLAEARAAAAVIHPGIATVLESDEAEGITYLAMELVAGETLRAALGRGPLPLKEALRLGSESAEGLAAAHRAGVVHRDLKPDNVMVTPDGHAKILDFGLARLLEPETRAASGAEAPTVAAPRALTIEGTILGTPAYMSPEQARGLPVDFRTDLFSFGSTLYEMVTGRAPFDGRTATDVMSALLQVDPLPVSALNPEAPSALQWILDKCLQKEAAERYQDTRDLVVDLRHLQEESATLALLRRTGTGEGAPAGAPEAARAPRRAWGRLGLAGLGAAIVLAAVLLVPRFLRPRGLAPPPAEAHSLAVFAFENLKDPRDSERFGQVLQELLITDLSGLSSVKVYSSQRLYDVRKQVKTKRGGAGGKELDSAVAAQAGARVMLTGSLSQLGERWILTSQLVNVDDGTVIQSNRIDGTDLYAMVDSLTDRVRGDLRISLPADLDTRLAVKEKTTSSMEAYRHYLAGVELLNEGQYREAAPELEQAVAIDPQFGQAYYQLAMAKWWPGDDVAGARVPLSQILDRGLYTSRKERLLAEGALKLVAHDYGEGATTFQQLVKEFPDEKEAWYGLGEALFHYPGGGRELEALQAFQQSVKLDPDFPLACQHIIDVYRMEKRYDDAIAEARALIARHPDNPLWHRNLAAVTERKGGEAETRLAVSEALRRHRTPEERRELYRMLAGMAGQRGDLPRAEEYLRKGLEADPGQDDPLIRLGLFRILLAQRKFAEYDRGVLQGLAANPGNPIYRESRMQIYVRDWRLAEGLAAAESLARADPADDAAAQWRLALSFLKGNEAGAGRALAEGERRHESRDEKRALYLTMGGILFQVGDYNRAKQSFERALGLEPEGRYADLFSYLGLVDLVLGRPAEAEKWLNLALEVNARYPTALAGLAIIQAVLERPEASFGYARKMIELYPEEPIGYMVLVDCCVMLDRLAEAAKETDAALAALRPAYSKWALLAGDERSVGPIYLAGGYLDQAEDAFRKADAIDPHVEDASVLGGWAMTEACRGDYERAAELARRGLAANPRHPWVLQAAAAERLGRRDLKGAERRLREQLDAGPVSTTSYRMLGTVCAEQGRFAEARSWAEKAAGMDSSRASKELLAWILLAGDLDVEQGARLAESALAAPAVRFGNWDSQLPSHPPAEHALGLARLKQKRHAEAVKYLEQAVVLQPHRESARADLAQARSLAGMP